MSEINEFYGNRLRIRACGIAVQNDGMLLVNHRNLTSGDFWSPPGGGVEFGETARQSLEREILEETGLESKAGEFLFACEFIRPPLHAVELYFASTIIGGQLLKGHDPELKASRQIIRDVQFVPWKIIEQMDRSALHGMFGFVNDPRDILQLKGYLSL